MQLIQKEQHNLLLNFLTFYCCHHLNVTITHVGVSYCTHGLLQTVHHTKKHKPFLRSSSHSLSENRRKEEFQCETSHVSDSTCWVTETKLLSISNRPNLKEFKPCALFLGRGFRVDSNTIIKSSHLFFNVGLLFTSLKFLLN